MMSRLIINDIENKNIGKKIPEKNSGIFLLNFKNLFLIFFCYDII